MSSFSGTSPHISEAQMQKRPLVAALCIGWAEVRDYEKILCCVLQTWQRPTLPRLETEYHWRWGVSRPCSERERVRPPRDNHQVGKTQHMIHAERMETVVSRSWRAEALFNLTRLVCDLSEACFTRQDRTDIIELCSMNIINGNEEVDRAISNGKLHMLPCFHTRPINVVVFHGSDREHSFSGWFPA
jgi:hypothetical protein